MKNVLEWIGKLLFVAMAVALIVYAASRTLDFVNSTLDSSDQVIGYLALFATTGGALAWLAVFLWNSKGIAQKGISLVMIIIDVLGEITLFTIDTLMRSGMNGLTATLSPEEIRSTVLGMSLLIGANIIAIFAFHIMDSENIAAIETHFQDQRVKAADDKIKKAITDAKVAKAESISNEIAEREADAYEMIQKFQDRSDHALPEKTLRDVFGGMFGKGKDEHLPIATADTVGIPELKPETPKTGGLYDAFREGVAQGLGVKPGDLKSPIDGAARVLSQTEEKEYLCQRCGSTLLESELIQSIHGKHKICGKLGCGGFVEEKAPSASFQKQEDRKWTGGEMQDADGNWHGV